MFLKIWQISQQSDCAGVYVLSNEGRKDRETLEILGYEGGSKVNNDVSKSEKWHRSSHQRCSI